MKVFLTSAYDDDEPLHTALQLAEQDRHKVHELVTDPNDADLILFVENSQYGKDLLYRQLQKHPLVQKYPTKSLMYNEQDKPIFAMPGLYVSLNKNSYDPKRQHPSGYVKDVNEYVKEYSSKEIEPDLLYSFMGGRKNRVRHKLFSVSHPRGSVQDTSKFSVFVPNHKLTTEDNEQKREYAKLLLRSKFVLCPKGAGTSSYRLFETMETRRVPVILSDDWIPPAGPKWDEFAVFVPEDDIIHIQSILEKIESTWKERGAIARENWEMYFAPDVRFHYIVEQCKNILEQGNDDPLFFKHQITKYELYMRLRLRLLPLVAKFEKVIRPVRQRLR